MRTLPPPEYVFKFSSPQIFLARHGLNMMRIHASMNTAQMVNVMAVRNWTVEEFMRDTVGDVAAILKVEVAISSRSPCPAPDPAIVRDLDELCPPCEQQHSGACYTAVALMSRTILHVGRITDWKR